MLDRNRISRRRFVGSAPLIAATARAAAAVAAPDAGSELARILARIRPPVFPDRAFLITRYGATGDGQRDSTGAIRKAIDFCSQVGGGRVVVPRGVFLTGAIHLKSNVNLHLEEGATLLFSRDPKAYLPVVFTRFESTECMNYSPFIYAWEQTNIAVTGTGTLDGNADAEHWWSWVGRRGSGTDAQNQRRDRPALVAAGEKDVPVRERVFGEGHYLRPNFVQPNRSSNVLIEGVTVKNSPMWELNPVQCRNVTVRGVKIDSHGPNNDGCDPECTNDVLIENCVFSTGDDCIAIKSGRDRDGRRVAIPCENLVIRNCDMKDGHGGVSIGSEVSGDVRNVFVENCRMDSPHLERALRIKTNSYRGGIVENVQFRNVQVGQVADAVVQIDFFYDRGEGGPMRPVVRNIVVEDVTSKKSKYGLHLRGYKNAPIEDVRLTRCTFDDVSQGNVIENVKGLEAKDVQIGGQAFTG